MKFLVVDDHTSCAVWDDIIGPVRGLLDDTWTIHNAMHAMMPPASAYRDFGVRVPRASELPLVFCVRADGSVEEQANATAAQILTFIKARIARR